MVDVYKLNRRSWRKEEMYLPRLLAENLLNRINLIFILPTSRRFSWLHVRVWMIKLPKKKYKLLSSLIFPSRLNRDVIPFIGDKKRKKLFLPRDGHRFRKTVGTSPSLECFRNGYSKSVLHSIDKLSFNRRGCWPRCWVSIILKPWMPLGWMSQCAPVINRLPRLLSK